MKCPICRSDEKFVRTYETIQHRNMTERRKLCIKCSSAWKTMEQLFAQKAEANEAEANEDKTNEAGEINTEEKKYELENAGYDIP